LETPSIPGTALQPPGRWGRAAVAGVRPRHVFRQNAQEMPKSGPIYRPPATFEEVSR